MKRVKIMVCIAILLLTTFVFAACSETNPDYKEWFTEEGFAGPAIGNASLLDKTAADFFEKWEKNEETGFWEKKKTTVADNPGNGTNENTTRQEDTGTEEGYTCDI